MSWLDGLRHRVRAFLLGERYAEEQAGELRAHLEMDAAQRQHDGHPPESAMTAARKKFGNETATREALRTASGFAFGDRLRQDLTYALRGLRRSPAFTATIVLTLALGVGANAAIFSFLDRVFVRAPSGVENPEGIRRLYAQFATDRSPTGEMTMPSFNYQSYEHIRDGAGSRATVVAFTEPDSLTIRVADTEHIGRASWVGADYFTTLGARAQSGRFFGPDEAAIESAADVAVISHAFRERAFGPGADALGRTVELARGRFTIIGVLAGDFAGIDLDAVDVFLPLGSWPVPPQAGVPWYRASGNYLTVFARFAPGEDERVALTAASASYNRQPEIRGYMRVPSTTIIAGPIVAARGPADRSAVLSIGTRVGGVAAIVLIIACANIATLLLVRTARRRREIAVRLALGVTRARLASQLLVESLVLAAIGGAAAIAVAWWGGTTLRRLLLPSVQWSGGPVDMRVLAFAALATATVGILAGLAPTAYALRAELGDALKGSARAGAYRRSRLRSALIVAQSALALVLIAGAGLFVRSLGNVRSIPIGYAVDSLLYASASFAPGAMDRQRLALGITELTRRLAGESGVLATAYSTAGPMTGWTGIGMSLPGRDSVPQLSPTDFAQMNWVSPGFFSAVGMPIVAGREFTPSDGGETIIVNETMARTFWPGEDPLGQCIITVRSTGRCSYVIGVARNAAKFRVIEEPTLQYFMPNGAPTTLIVRAAPRQTAAIAQLVRAAMREEFPAAEVIRVVRMRDRIDAQLRPWQLGASLFVAFGVLAVVVAAVGVYSVLAYSVSQRTHEIGVRMALGARANHVVRTVLAEGVWVVLLGAVLGIGVAMAAGKLVAAHLYGVTARDPVVLASAAVVLFIVGLAAGLIPAWRAVRVDPVTTLRAD